MFRREWHQQILVLALLGVAVTVATVGAAFAYNVAPDGRGEFGSAGHRITFSAGSQAAAAADIAAAAEYFGTIDVLLAHFAPVAGSARPLEVRAQDPHGPFSGPMLALREGRYPSAPEEVALTESAARDLHVSVGGVVDLDGRRPTLVGLVENPRRLDDDFALVAPRPPDATDLVRILVGGSQARVEQFRGTMTVDGDVRRDSPRNDKTVGAVATFGLATVGMLLVALIAAAGFVVLAQRRLRELGLLAAMGATERHVRLVTLLNGVLVGLSAAVIGTAGGLAAWALASGRVEAAAGHRIDGLSVPWWLVAISVLLAVVTATGAAWWPARAVARIPVMLALSRRPPAPKPARRPAAVAAVLIVAGLGCFALAHQKNVALIVAGTLATPIGVLLMAPLAVSAAGRMASRLPVSGRLALRDLGRYRARAGAALAAISLALGVPVAVVIVATANAHTAAEGNLSDRQLLIRVGHGQEPFAVTPGPAAALEALGAGVDQLAVSLGGATVTPLDLLVDPARIPEPQLAEAGQLQAVEVNRRRAATDDYDGLLLYVATPAVLDTFHIPPTGGGIVTAEDGDLFFLTKERFRDPEPLTDVVRIPTPGYTSVPDTFISPTVAAGMGWEPIRAGWFMEADHALTTEERAAAHDLAVDAGLTVETRDQQASLAGLRSGATAAGMLLALGVLAMTVGLIRSEAAGDLRILAAAGASSTVRRNLTAATAGSLALLGVLLGTAGAYLVLVGAYAGDLEPLTRVPFGPLAAIACGVPAIAVAAGWLLAGRQPPALARSRFD
jgi:putative ABC transport system permease protein